MVSSRTNSWKPDAGPVRLLFVQTQAIAAGAQEISRLLGEQLAEKQRDGEREFEIHHLFFYRITDAFDHLDNVHFCVEEAPRGPLSILRFLYLLVRMMRRIRPDVVLTFQHYGNIFGAPAARLSGARATIANHVSAPATIGKAARLIDRYLGILGFYDAITVNSRETQRDYATYPQSYRKRLVLVPHGFEDKTVAIAKADARATFGLPLGIPLIGSVARLHPLKQLDAAVRALTRLPEAHLAFAGTGPDEQRLRALTEELGVDARMHFLGELHPQDIGRFLATLDVFAFPSLAETFGLAAVEAAQAGVPVVAQDLPVLREVLDLDGQPCALFVEAADTEVFASALGSVLDDSVLAAQLSGRGRQLSKRYSLGAMVDSYRELALGLLSPTDTAGGQQRGAPLTSSDNA